MHRALVRKAIAAKRPISSPGVSLAIFSSQPPAEVLRCFAALGGGEHLLRCQPRAANASLVLRAPSPACSNHNMFLAAILCAAAHVYHVPFESMGTQGELVAWTNDERAADRAFASAREVFARVDTQMRPWGDSELGRLNANAGRGAVQVSPDTFAVLERAQRFSVESNGLFDVTFASMGALWHFEGPASLPSVEAVAVARAHIDYRQLVLDAAAHTAALSQATAQVGLGGIAKGYAVDQAVAALRAHGLSNFIVKLGGDLYASGTKGGVPWTVGIQDPRGASAFAELAVTDAAFSTSGDYEHFFFADGKRYHHIIDPRTGYPATASRSVTVLTHDALTAEGLTKILFIAGIDGTRALARYPGSEAVIVTADNQLWRSPGLRTRLKVLHPPSD